MSDVDKLQNAEEAVEQLAAARKKEEADRHAAELAREPVKNTAQLPRHYEEIPWGQIDSGNNLRTGTLPDIDGLALSIKERGLWQPLAVRPDQAIEGVLRYQLVDGARRLAAYKLVFPDPETVIPVIVGEGLGEAERYELMFTTMAHFHDWEPVAKARALRYLLDLNSERSASDLARSLGLKAEFVQRHLRILDLPKEVRERLEKGDLSFTVADLLRRGISTGRLTEEEAGEMASSYALGDISPEELRDLAAPPRQVDPLAEGDDSAAPWGSKEYDPEFEQKMNDLEAAADEKLQAEREAEELEAEADRLLSAGGKGKLGGTEVADDDDSSSSTDSVGGPNKRRVYSYLLGRLLRDMAPKGYLDELGITVGEVFNYAWNLDNAARLAALVELGQAMAEDDMALPDDIFPNGV